MTYVVNWSKWREEGPQVVLGGEWRKPPYKDLAKRELKLRLPGGLIHTIVLSGSKGGTRVWSPAEQVLKHCTSTGVLVNLSRRQSKGRQGAGVIRIKALQTLLATLGQGVEQLRDAAGATRCGSCSLRFENQPLCSRRYVGFAWLWGRSTWGRQQGYCRPYGL
jgi:hypothetical protein